MAYKWKFFKSARCVQVKIERGADVAALGELDQRLWTVLSASTAGLRFDEATLRLLDADGDGRIRAPDVLAAVDWMRARFKTLDFLFAGKGEVALDDLDEATEEFYASVARAAGLPIEQVLRDTLFKLAGELALEALARRSSNSK